MRMLSAGEQLFPGIIGFDATVITEINLGLIAGHDLLFLGEKGQAKSRLMRLLLRFLDEEIPYLDIPGCPVRSMRIRTIRLPSPVAGWWPRIRSKRFQSPGGLAKSVTRNALPPAPNSPT
jgi:hypothetical protein